MGNVGVAVKTMCQALDVPYVMPDENSKKTLQTGAYYSPEEICLPFKIILGNLIQGVERGADTILTTGSCGPCRYGEYCELQMKILKRLGYGDLKFIVADLSHDIGFDEFKRRIGKIGGASKVGRVKALRAPLLAVRVLGMCDKIDSRAHYLAGYEKKKGTCKEILKEYRAKALKCGDPEEITGILRSYIKKLDGVETDMSRNPTKISIVGEIYTVIEPFSNLYIEEKLMDYGVSSKRTLSPSWWIRDLAMKPLKCNSAEINRAAGKYMPYQVGGHGRECIGEAALAKKEGMDGVIQIFPLGCMPEVIAKSILPSVQRDTGVPAMTLIVDEITGEAGYVTRIEAFLDMLESRKRRKISGASATG